MQGLSGLITARPTIPPFIKRVTGLVTRFDFPRLIGVSIDQSSMKTEHRSSKIPGAGCPW